MKEVLHLLLAGEWRGWLDGEVPRQGILEGMSAKVEARPLSTRKGDGREVRLATRSYMHVGEGCAHRDPVFVESHRTVSPC